MDLYAYYTPRDFNERDQEAKQLVAPFTEKYIGSGTFLPTGERDIQWRLKDGCGDMAMAALKRAGFRTALRKSFNE